MKKFGIVFGFIIFLFGCAYETVKEKDIPPSPPTKENVSRDILQANNKPQEIAASNQEERLKNKESNQNTDLEIFSNNQKEEPQTEDLLQKTLLDVASGFSFARDMEPDPDRPGYFRLLEDKQSDIQSSLATMNSYIHPQWGLFVIFVPGAFPTFKHYSSFSFLDFPGGMPYPSVNIENQSIQTFPPDFSFRRCFYDFKEKGIFWGESDSDWLEKSICRECLSLEDQKKVKSLEKNTIEKTIQVLISTDSQKMVLYFALSEKKWYWIGIEPESACTT